MSKTYSIDISLNAQYDKKNIEKILIRSLELGINLHKYVWNTLNVYSDPVNLNEAIDSVLIGDNDLHCINLKISNTFVTLHFMNYQPKLCLMMTNFNYPWLRTFEDDEEDIDIGRYAKIMFDLAQDFKILEMRIEKS